jgi:hypothetical protein
LFKNNKGIKMEVLTPIGIEELNKFIAILRTIPPNIEWETSQRFVPYSSESSRDLYSRLIALCEEVITHNDTSYWSREENRQKVRNFRQLFDGGMENFAPACFDQLSAQVATAYISLLDTLQKKEVFTSRAKTLIDTGSFGNFDKLITFVKNNTRHLINLFELVAQQKISEHSDLREEQLAFAIIKTTDILLNYIAAGKPIQQLADANLAYEKLTGDESTTPAALPETLTVQQVVTHYTTAVSSYAETILTCKMPLIGFAGLNGEMGIEGEHLCKVIGESAIRTIDNKGVFHNPFTNLKIKYLKQYRIKALTADENLLLKKARKISSEEITVTNGFLHKLTNQFSPETYIRNLLSLADKFKEIKAQLKKYKAGTDLSFLSRNFGGTNPEKITIASTIVTKTRTLLKKKEDNGKRMFFADYLAEMLITMLQSDAEHAQIVRTNSNVSYGSLGGMIAEFITSLYTFMNEIDLSCSPSVFYESLAPDEQQEFLTTIKPPKAEKTATATT